MTTARRRRTPDQRFAVLILNILAALILLIATASVAAASASAKTPPKAGPPVRPEDVGEGSLLLRPVSPDKARASAYRAALVQKSEVEIDVSGLVVRAVVRQEFNNSADTWMEGIYVFPLPHKAAVDSLRLTVGDRVIEGRIEKRKKAQEQFAEARRQGRKAALVEAERPNIFTVPLWVRFGSDAQKVSERRHPVRHVDGMIHTTRSKRSPPIDERRGTYTALVKLSLLASKRKVRSQSRRSLLPTGVSICFV